MIPETVAFLDSGVGGLPYLAHARRHLGARRFVYVADRENFPYGEKSHDAIIAAAVSVAGRLMERERPRLVVVACNTMSVVALAELRARFAVPFVGVVPAVKPAASLSRRKRVGVLATRQTVEGDYLRGLIVQHAAGCEVVSLSSSALVEFVENGLFTASPAEREDRVRREVDRFRSEGIDALVLGCTHFLHLEAEFHSLLDAESIALVDSREGVARQAARLLAKLSCAAEDAAAADAAAGDAAPTGAAASDGLDSLYVTGQRPSDNRYEWFAGQFGLRLRGSL